jgi:hypothetical protein
VWTLFWWVPQFANGAALQQQAEEEEEGNQPGQEPPSSTVDFSNELVRPIRITAGVVH